MGRTSTGSSILVSCRQQRSICTGGSNHVFQPGVALPCASPAYQHGTAYQYSTQTNQRQDTPTYRMQPYLLSQYRWSGSHQRRLTTVHSVDALPFGSRCFMSIFGRFYALLHHIPLYDTHFLDIHGLGYLGYNTGHVVVLDGERMWTMMSDNV